MVFKSIKGLIECQNFSDFWVWHLINSNKLTCPNCNKQALKDEHFTGFDMNKTGQISFKGIDPKCEFNKMNFTVEAIPRSEQKW